MSTNSMSKMGVFCKQCITTQLRLRNGLRFTASFTHLMGVRIDQIAQEYTLRIGLRPGLFTTKNGRSYVVYPKMVFEATYKRIFNEIQMAM